MMVSQDGIDHHSQLDDRYPEKRTRIGSDDGFSVKADVERRTKKKKPMYTLKVIQQPERARLCSYKEENETIDRRPVDPPPVVEMLPSDASSALESEASLTKYFIRASIVHLQPTIASDSSSSYSPVKTPTGADASAGEVVQTPERLRALDGQSGQLVVFAKLSVRMPGVFRLKFTLFQTADTGLTEVAHTISEPFEVFSPKLFKGMRESTALTRHLAAQGLKVKLRTDTSVGRQSETRRRGSALSTPSSPIPPYKTYSEPMRAPFPTTTQRPQMMPVPSPSVPSPPSSAPPRTLVWQGPDPYHRRPSIPHTSYPPGPSHMSEPPLDMNSRTRYMDDGFPTPLRDVSSPLSWTPASSDLAAFSLNQSQAQRPNGGPAHSPSRPAFSTSAASSAMSTSRTSSRAFSPYPTHAPSMSSRTSSERSDSMPTVGSLRLRGQDDGFPFLPIIPTQPSVTNLLSNPIRQPEIDTANNTLPPLRNVLPPSPGPLPPDRNR